MFRQTDRERCDKLFDKYYAGRVFSRGTYERTIRQHLFRGARLLDAGCGRYLEFSRELGADVTAVGVDLETTLETRNVQSPYGVRANLEHLPFPADYFDIVISRSVIEHLEQPLHVFREFQRVLKPGGKVILSTPNKYDYVSVFASLTPYRWHRYIVSRIVGVSEDDVFPTFYRANTLRRITEVLNAAGLQKLELRAINHYPVYLMFSPILFRLGVLYERVTSADRLQNFRGTLLAVFQKPLAASTGAPRAVNQSGPEEVESSSISR